MEKTSVNMEQDMIDNLDAIADDIGMNRSQVIRKAVKDYIEAYPHKGGKK